MLAARIFKVPRSTIRGRLKGGKPRQHAHEEQQLLSSAEELVLLIWLGHLSDQARPLSKRTIKQKVQWFCGQKPGKHWIARFLKRYPEIALGRSSGLDPKRAQAFNWNTVMDHFQQFKEIVETHQIPWENIYNMDEKGIQRGGGRKAQGIKYFVPRNRRQRYKEKSGNLELVTAIECICADGTTLMPGFVFPGKEFHPEWFDEAGVTVSMSDSGWTDNFLGAEWFKQTFLPQAKSRNVSRKPILLIIDGHDSHITAEVQQLAIDNNVHLFLLPAHTTHRLQPCDVGAFGPLQILWQERCNDILDETGEEMPITELIKEYLAVRTAAFKEQTILKAWEKAGLHPLNPSVFTDADFAPSQVSSRHAHIPSGIVDPSADNVEPNFSDSSSDSSQDSDDNTSESDSDEPSQIEFMVDAYNHHPSSSMSTKSTIPPPCTPSAPSPSNLSFNSRELLSSPKSRRSQYQSSRIHLQPSSSSPHPSPPTPTPTPRANPELPEADQLRAEITELRLRVGRTEAHNVMLFGHLEELQQKVNHKQNKKTRQPTFPSNIRVLTTETAQATIRQLREVKEGKQRKKDEVKQQKDDELQVRQMHRAELATSGTFSGALSSKSKEDLKDVVFALSLPMEGTVKSLVETISTHLDAHPELENDQRFSGLFKSRQRGQKRSAPSDTDPNNENLPPLANRRRLNSPLPTIDSQTMRTPPRNRMLPPSHPASSTQPPHFSTGSTTFHFDISTPAGIAPPFSPSHFQSNTNASSPFNFNYPNHLNFS